MLRRQEGYALRKIKEKNYLMPYGQKIADQRKGMVLNETGSFLWNFLEQPKEREEILEAVIQYYEIEEKERGEIEKQIGAFINQLLTLGVLNEDLKPLQEPFWGAMEIGMLRVGLYGREEFFSEKFKPFLKNNSFENIVGESASIHKQVSEQRVEVLYGIPPFYSNGKILLKNKELEVFDLAGIYELYFPTMKNIQKVYVTKDTGYARIYCNLEAERADETEKEIYCENLFHVIRHIFLLYAQKNGYYALHSASILYRGQAWLFSGHSGMGKSTHTALWHEYVDTPYLNGDLNLIGKNETGEGYCIYGIPWCGTSGLCTTETIDLGGIVLLGRDVEDHVEELSPFEQVLRVTQRMISPAWTEQMATGNLEFVEQMAEKAWITQLFCTKNPSAVEVIQKWIDEKNEEIEA
nr:PqqD family protein [uncultured Mediterraneibacter sp.]